MKSGAGGGKPCALLVARAQKGGGVDPRSQGSLERSDHGLKAPCEPGTNGGRSVHDCRDAGRGWEAGGEGEPRLASVGQAVDERQPSVGVAVGNDKNVVHEDASRLPVCAAGEARWQRLDCQLQDRACVSSLLGEGSVDEVGSPDGGSVAGGEGVPRA